MDWKLLLVPAIITIFSATIGWAANHYWYARNNTNKEVDRLAKEREELAKRVTELESQLGAVKQAVTPISAAFQAILIKELTHFHTPEMDELMVKLGPPITLTEIEKSRLTELLLVRAKDLDGRISDLERDAAIMLPMVMKRVLNDVSHEQAVELSIVSTPRMEGLGNE